MSGHDIDALRNLPGDPRNNDPTPMVPTMFPPGYEWRAFKPEDVEPQPPPQILLYRGRVCLVRGVTTSMRVWGSPTDGGKSLPAPESVKAEKARHLKLIFANELDPTDEVTFKVTNEGKQIVLKKENTSILQLGVVKHEIVGAFPGTLKAKISEQSVGLWCEGFMNMASKRPDVAKAKPAAKGKAKASASGSIQNAGKLFIDEMFFTVRGQTSPMILNALIFYFVS